MPSSAGGQCFVYAEETYGLSGDNSLRGEGHGCFSPSAGARGYLATALLCAGITRAEPYRGALGSSRGCAL